MLSNLYDGGGRLLAQTDASGFTSFLTNNAALHTATVTNGTVVTTTLFDNAGRPVTNFFVVVKTLKLAS